MCGEHFPDRRAGRAFPRFIPTCVGNMMELVIFSDIITVHPHVCGEHSAQTFASRRFGRFIPTCVGNMAEDQKSFLYPYRFIPTCVGNMKFAWVNVWPIIRFIPTCVGNMLAPYCYRPQSRGSSPRVWGTFLRRDWLRPLTAVHPHVCGEH